MGADAVLRTEVRRILGSETPEELIKALTGPELEAVLVKAHEQARGFVTSSCGVIPADFDGHVPRGLSNLGNTCFLASVLQCLAQTENFSQELTLTPEGRLGGIGGALRRVLQQLRSAEEASVEEILGELAERYSWYRGKSQQDAHELLRTLLAALADEREVKEDKETLQQLVHRSFRGQMCEAILCWSCREISFRHEFFLDFSLDLSEEDPAPGPLGLRGWVMQPMPSPEEEEVDEEAEADGAEAERAAESLEEHVIEVQLERVPGRRIALGFEWQELPVHQCKVLRRIHPNSLAEQWNKRFNRRLTPGLLLLSVNGEEDHEEIMQILKDEAKLSLRFAPEEVMRRFGATQGSAKGFQVDLTRETGSKRAWGFQLDQKALEMVGSTLIVAQIHPDSLLDAWNLRCRSMGSRAKLVVHPGDRILSVNGESDNVQAMVKALQSQTRQKNSILLEPGDRDAYMGGYPAGAERAEDAEAQFEVALEDSLGPFGFQVEHQRVKGIDEGSPLAMWNLVCRSRGEEDLCVELGDTLLQEASSSGRRIFQLRRSKERQASVRALGARPDAASGTAAARGAGAEGPRVEMVRAAEECVAALDKPLRELFETKPRPKVVSLADCVRDLGAIEALEESFEAIYKCQHCTPSRTFASKRAWLWGSLPPVLPVQLKRFRRERDGAFRKSQTRIQTSSTLDLSDLLLSSKEQQLLKSLVKKEHEALNAEVSECAVYELYAVCAHLGGSMERGHYVAFINAGRSLKEEAWFLLDDARTLPCRREDALRVEAYIAFYRKPAGAPPNDPS
ncbi:unnamed protein product [Durusdinium trenchii]|uniref:Ubiquitin carboxyl-terminal hydrolase n=1 Tax=Durusdinium trenchii TaxID=1381693 RepID=A0ABP0R2M2_9DINO